MSAVKPVQKISNIDITILICFKYVRNSAISLQWPGDAKNHFLVQVSKCIDKISFHDVVVEGGLLDYQMIYGWVGTFSNEKYCFPSPKM